MKVYKPFYTIFDIELRRYLRHLYPSMHAKSHWIIASLLLAISFFSLPQTSFSQCPINASCTPGGASNPLAPAFGGGIYRVSFAGIDNVTAGSPDGYQNYCSLGTQALTINQPVSISVRTGNSLNENVRIWIDYNNDGVFNATTELVFTSNNLQLHAGNFTIPSNAVQNLPLRMRISADGFSSAVPTPCSTPEFSQVEDYSISAGVNALPPQARFTSPDTISCTGSVRFTDQSINGPDSWLWSFGDGQFSIETNPTHQYTVGGRYTVKLKVENIFGADSLTRINYINYNDTVPVVASCNPVTVEQCCGYGITNFTFAGINNNSAVGSYQNFTCTQRGFGVLAVRYPMSVSTNPTLEQDTRIWIDYNSNGIFSADELAFEALNAINPTGTIQIPSTGVTLNQPLRIRVISDFAGNPFGPCTNPTRGQVEDYSLVIRENTLPPIASFVVNTNSACDSSKTFVSTSQNIITQYIWFYGDGNSDTTSSPSITYAYTQTGVFDVKLKVIGLFGVDSVTITGTAQFLQAPVAACAITSVRPFPTFGIFNVSLANINNSSASAAEGYQDFTCVAQTTLLSGNNYTLTVTTNQSNPEIAAAWIDFNNDGAFSLNERILLSTALRTHTVSFIVPSNSVFNRALRIRVASRAQQGGVEITPCGNIEFGQAEDYGVIILENVFPPVARFTVSDTLSCTGFINFTSTSLNSPSSYLWNFGDGTTSTLQNPSHTYSTTGTYTISLKVINGFGADSLTRTNLINVTQITGLKPIACKPLTTNFCCNFGITRVQLGTLNNPSANASAGYQDFTCNFSAPALKIDTAYTLTVTVSANNFESIRAWIDFNNSGTFEANELVASANNTRNVFTSLVSIPGSAVTGVGLRMRIISDNNLETNPNPCANLQLGQAEDYQVLLVNPNRAPQANFGFIQATACVSTISFVDSTFYSPTSWLWSFGDGNTSTQQNPTHTYLTTGTFTVKLKVSNPSGVDSLERTNLITIINGQGLLAASCSPQTQNPNPQFQINIRRVELANLDFATNTFDYTDVSCGQRANLEQGNRYTLAITTGTNTPQNVRVWIDYNYSGIFEESELILTSVNVGRNHLVSFTVPGTAVSNLALRMRVSTDFNNPNLQPCTQPNFGQVVDLSVIVAATTRPPLVAFGASTTNTCLSTISFSDSTIFSPTSWLWSFGDGNVSPLQNPVHTYANTGVYTVKLVVSNAFGSDSLTKINYITITPGNGLRPAPCTPQTQNPTALRGIFNVTFGSINNTSVGAIAGYQDFACSQRATLIERSTVTLTVRTGNQQQESVRAWIDYNYNGTFENSELVLQSNNNFLHSSNVTLPLTTFQGTALRMRVISDVNANAIGSCVSPFTGQVEDYSVVINQNVSAPVAQFGSATPITCYTRIVFTDSSTNVPTSWSWNFGDGGTSAARNPAHNYTAPGVYTVILIATNNFGSDTLVRTNFITITDGQGLLPPSCSPQTQNRQNNPQQWGITNVTFANLNNSSQNGLAGYQDFACSDKATVIEGTLYQVRATTSLVTQENLRVYIDYNNNGSFQANEQIYNNNAQGVQTFSFTPPATAVQGIALRMRFIADGRNTISGPCYQPENGQVEDYSVVIRNQNTPPVTYFGSNVTVTCQTVIAFRDSSLNNPITYLWNFGDGNTSAQRNPTHNYSTAGTYTVTLITTNNFGSDTLVRENFITIINPLGLVPAQCTPTTLQTTNPNTGIFNVNFAGINNQSGGSNLGYQEFTCSARGLVARGGTYTLSVNTRNIRHNIKAFIDFNGNGTFDQDEQVAAFQGVQNQSAQVTISETALQNTALRMRIIADPQIQLPTLNACQNMNFGQAEDYSIVVDLVTGKENNMADKGLQVFPNPTQGNVSVRTHHNNFNWQLMTHVGQVVQQGTSAKSQLDLQTTNLPAGVYMLLLTNGNTIEKAKIIKQ